MLCCKLYYDNISPLFFWFICVSNSCSGAIWCEWKSVLIICFFYFNFRFDWFNFVGSGSSPPTHHGVTSYMLIAAIAYIIIGMSRNWRDDLHNGLLKDSPWNALRDAIIDQSLKANGFAIFSDELRILRLHFFSFFVPTIPNLGNR